MQTDLIRRARELAALAEQPDVFAEGPYEVRNDYDVVPPAHVRKRLDGLYEVAHCYSPGIARLFAASWDMAHLLHEMADLLEASVRSLFWLHQCQCSPVKCAGCRFMHNRPYPAPRYVIYECTATNPDDCPLVRAELGGKR